MHDDEQPRWFAPAVYFWTAAVIAGYMIQFRGIIGPAFKSFTGAFS
ncbi:MAG: hypothetical protein ACYYKD_10165 [Rhodospirillales bacterium]